MALIRPPTVICRLSTCPPLPLSHNSILRSARHHRQFRLDIGACRSETLRRRPYFSRFSIPSSPTTPIQGKADRLVSCPVLNRSGAGQRSKRHRHRQSRLWSKHCVVGKWSASAPSGPPLSDNPLFCRKPAASFRMRYVETLRLFCQRGRLLPGRHAPS